MSISKPKAILTEKYTPPGEPKISSLSATEFWLCNDNGVSHYVKWWGNGWVVVCQESYLCKNKTFKHKSEIPSFDHSQFGDNWEHVFNTPDEAVEFYRMMNFPELVKSEKFYGQVYDLLILFGGAPNTPDHKQAFIYEFMYDKHSAGEWRFQGKLGFGGKYWSEINEVSCYSEDETPERLALIKLINKELKKLQNEN